MADKKPANFFPMAPGPHPRRVLTLMPRLGFARPRLGMAAGAALLCFLTASVIVQSARSIALQVSETAGIRRTEYPVSARVEIPRGGVSDLDHVRLRAGDTDVAAQYAIGSRWPDNSVRSLDVDFNLSIGPGESRVLQVDYGPDVNRPASVPRGLTLVEEADAVQAGNVKFGKSGAPLIVAANYRGEFIGKGSNGVVVIDASGARHDLGSAQNLTFDIVKRGPLLVIVRYSGKLPIDSTYMIPFTLTCEMPNSKSWVKTSVSLEDPARRIKTVSFETPLALGEKPWTWDVATDSGTYGVFRNATDAARFAQTVSAKGNSWIVETGVQNELRPYETSMGGRATTAKGWGHILDARGAMAFGVERFASEPGTYEISLNGQGQLTFAVTPAQPKTQHRLTVYEHFVSTPVAIGAATNPTAMLSQLVVKVGN